MECYDKYKFASVALYEKRTRQRCESIWKMLKAIKKGRGRHLIAIVEPHLCECLHCQEMARKRGWDLRKIIREAS